MNNSIKRYIGIFIILCVQVAIGISSGVLTGYMSIGDSIPKGVKINGVNVGGFEAKEAIAAVCETVKQIPENGELILKAEDKSFTVSFKDINARYDIDNTVKEAIAKKRKSGNLFNDAFGTFKDNLTNEEIKDLSLGIKFDSSLLKQYLDNIAEQINVPCSNASFLVENNKIEVIPEIIGRKLNIEKNISLITKNINNKRTFDLIVEDDIPNVSENDFEGINELIVEFSTTISQNNMSNIDYIQASADALNQVIVKPEGKVSFLKYLTKQLENNEKLKLVPNVGIDQVASTLYNALLLSDISVLERTCEKFPVNYIETGREAVIVDPYIDLVFENNKQYPILILLDVNRNKINAKIYGTPEPGLKITLENRDRKVIPRTAMCREDYDLPKGKRVLAVKGKDGIKVNVYKVYDKKGDGVWSELISTNVYEPQNDVINVGAKSTTVYDEIMK